MPDSAQDRIVDDNIVLRDMDGKPAYLCRHCGTFIADAELSWREHLPTTFLGAPSTAGPHLNDNALQYLDIDVQLRQGYCPGCFTALFTETVPKATAPKLVT